MSRGKVIDLFAGGGGASKAIHLATNIWEVDPDDALRAGESAFFLWASPDCRDHSNAKGGAPRSPRIRSLAWVVYRWAKAARPKLIFLENVPEFEGWGPLGPDGKREKARKGKTFRKFAAMIQNLGYEVDWRVLDASLYGARTRRRRLFLIARCDGHPIAWPKPTHGPGRAPLRTAAECIDWSLPCPSIFDRKKPLAEKTLWRIAQGLRRFVFDNPKPFIVKVNHGKLEPRCEAIDAPLSTITATQRGHGLVVPVLQQSGYGERGGVHFAEVRAFLTAYYGNDATGGQLLTEPMRTLTAKHRLGLVTVAGVDYAIVDIGFRMLEPHELLRAQFGRYAADYDLSAAKTKKDQIRLIGNSVPPELAEEVIRANVNHAQAEAA